ncbi:MAG: extracellular solute-binding protein [Patescibacteria group bacterium]|nr:extracellular solute-binding protein [Patescibacteria group bacterium]
MRKLTISTIVLSLMFLGISCGGSGVTIRPVTLEYWRMDDSPEVLATAIEEYTKLHPNVSINVRSFRADEYELALLEAIAENRGPDMFSVPNTWLDGWKEKILPMPETTIVPSQVVTPDKKIVEANLESDTITKLELINDYVEVVVDDVVKLTTVERRGDKLEEKIWGIPYSAESIAIFYNVDLLRQVDISEPPETWKQLQDYVKKLTVLDDDGNIEQSGAAIGTSRNVRHHTELIAAIMMQNGAQMIDGSGYARFDRYTPDTSHLAYPPGVQALVFYQSFGRKGTSTYTWNNDMPDSLDAFIAGKTAFYFGFPYDRDEIRDRAPRLNFKTASMPQVDPTEVRNNARYPVETVSKKTANPNEAWDFLLFAASEEQVVHYLRETGRPTALRNLIDDQLLDADAAPFVTQVLTSESWYRGKDYSKVEEAFGTMIETYPSERRPDYTPIVSTAASVVNATLR